ncbi:MAG: Soluble P-type ATPase-like phosphatase [Methanosaeta sp. PtaU1.Bin060]|nr:MAG: Soluble P-type ATPase-like phosphatase [Methanosaeta sp. PtaU1.Bin060]
MSGDIAVVLDVAGTMLRMYRVAKDLGSGLLLKKVVTSELIMEKSGRALVVPQIRPDLLWRCPPDEPLSSLFKGKEAHIGISCSSSPISREQVASILLRSRAKVSDLQEVQVAVRARCPEEYQTTGMIVDEDLHDVTHVISTGGTPFPGLCGVLREIESIGADIYVASGDSMRSLVNLKGYGIDLGRVYPVASPKRKQEIVMELKERYGSVVMVGDGLNDLYALRAADLGVLSVQQDSQPALNLVLAADEIMGDIKELPGILKRRIIPQRRGPIDLDG